MQFSVKQHLQFGKCLSKFARLEQVRWIFRPTAKIQLRLRISLEQQHPVRPKRAANLREKRSLQVPDVEYQVEAPLGNLHSFQIGLNQIDARMRGTFDVLQPPDSPRGKVLGSRTRFQY